MDVPHRSFQSESWFAPLSIDLLLKVLYVTFFHPFIAWVVVLCFRAQHMEYDAMPMRVTMIYASFVTFCWVLSAINRRLAFGMPREVDLDDEVIVITGGASGLGLLIAEVYGMRGASVAVLDVKDMENGESRGVSHYKCDITDKAALKKVAAQIEEELGTPTVLINNAAIVNGKPLLEMEIDDIERSLSTNLVSHFYTLKTFLPAIIRGGKGGTVVTISSVIGQLGSAGLTDYAAAKGGLIAMHKSLTAELRQAHPDIRTVLVTPGQLSTPLFYGVRTPSTVMAPVVEPVEVAREIINAIDNGKADHIGMPFYARWCDWYNVLPVSLQLLARRVSGIDRAMETFVGRQGAKKEGVLLEGL